jgi:hypothetical protein
MKADDRILSAARNAKGCPFQGSSRVPQPWQDLKASRALKTRLFGDRGFESFFLQRGVIQNPIIPTDLDGQAVGLPRTKECHETGGQHDAKVKCFSL